MTADDPYGGYPIDDHLRLSNPHGLEDAWRQVQAALPDGASVAGVSRGRGPSDWTAQATGQRGYGISGYGHDPEAAMFDLLDRVKEERHRPRRR